MDLSPLPDCAEKVATLFSRETYSPEFSRPGLNENFRRIVWKGFDTVVLEPYTIICKFANSEVVVPLNFAKRYYATF